MYLMQTTCCAVRDIGSLGIERSAKEAMLRFCQLLRGYSRRQTFGVGAHYTFTAVTRDETNYGTRFRDFILKNKLGTIVESEEAVNRLNTGNPVKIWVWTPAPDLLNQWYNANKRTYKRKAK